MSSTNYFLFGFVVGVSIVFQQTPAPPIDTFTTLRSTPRIEYVHTNSRHPLFSSIEADDMIACVPLSIHALIDTLVDTLIHTLMDTLIYTLINVRQRTQHHY